MSGVLTQFSSENHNDGMQNKKGRTITFSVDDEVAEKLEKYAKMRNTSMSRVLRVRRATFGLNCPRKSGRNRERNRQIYDQLRKKGYSISGGEINAGFGWSSWVNQFDDILKLFYPYPI